MMQKLESAPVEALPFNDFEAALVQLREALTAGDLSELNQANDELRAAMQRVQPYLGSSPRSVNAARQDLRFEKIQREVRIAGELLARANAANRRALSVFSASPSSYGPNGL